MHRRHVQLLGSSGRASTSAAASVLLVALLTCVAPQARAAPPSPSPTNRRIAVTVTDLTPTTPLFSTVETTLTIKLTLTNTTDAPLRKVSVTGYRDSPYTKASQLQAALASPASPSRQAGMMHSMPAPDLEPYSSRDITFTATASLSEDSDMCLCGDGVYPLDFSVSATASSKSLPVPMGLGQTYLPSFTSSSVSPVEVTWIWPLIDRPHRVNNGDEFIDDDLAKSISPGGRLDRALQVLERLPAGFHLTAMVDPELIAELLAMVDGYTVADGGVPVAGTHGSTAASWLARFRQVALSQEIRFTPTGDPDPEALTRLPAKSISGVSAQIQSQATASQSTAAQLTRLAWPPQGSATSAGVRELVDGGARTLLLSQNMLETTTGANATGANATGANGTGSRPSAVAIDIPGAQGMTALVTDDSTQGLAADVVSGQRNALAPLVGFVAIQAAGAPKEHHDLTIAAPRYVDPDVEIALRGLLETAMTSWSAPVSAGAAAEQAVGLTATALRYPEKPASTVPSTFVATARQAADSTRAFTSSFVDPAEAIKVVGDYRAATQWGVSNAWTQDGSGRTYESRLVSRSSSIQAKIQIVRPANGSYTLASASAPLLVSVINTLPYAVRVSVKLSPVGSIQGLTTDDIGPQVIQGNGGQVSLRIPAHVQRTGRFDVVATLRTPDGTPLGQPVRLSVRSTVIGPVGLIIMVVAGLVLIVALGGRFVRRLRRGPSAHETATVTATREIVAADEAAVEAADDEAAQADTEHRLT